MSNKYRFINACRFNDIITIKKLVYEGVDIHTYNEYGFKLACRNGHLKIIHYLIKLYKKHKCYKPINIYDQSRYGDGFGCMNYNYPVKLIANLGNCKKSSMTQLIGGLNHSRAFGVLTKN